jgi:uncharacterized protein DUF4350
MRNRHNGLLWALALALLAALVWGLEQVAVAPLETGEVYPPYSSLRSDPLGAKALYDSLAALPELTVERLYKQRTAVGAGAVLFILGVDPVGWSSVTEKTLTDYENLLSGGGRLVIAFLPVRAPSKPGTGGVIQQRWNLRPAYRSDAAADEDRGAIPRRSSLFFEPGPEWRVLAQRDGDATAVERRLGGGAVVLAADSYPLSNEGLRDARDAAYIVTLAGEARRIVFDENHFGVVESGSVATLMRKYRLEGAVAMLVLVAALFLWRSASSFLPAREPAAAEAVAGRDSLEGLAALLRRGVPQKDLLDACFAEWTKSAPRDRNSQQVEAEIARLGKHDPVEAYRAACRALARKR